MIEAVKQGVHVYVEKPVSHTVLEGRAMVAAAQAANRVVQVGTHRRVSPHCQWAREFIQSGKLGKVGAVRCFVHYAGGPEEPTANTPAPKAWIGISGAVPRRCAHSTGSSIPGDSECSSITPMASSETGESTGWT